MQRQFIFLPKLKVRNEAKKRGEKRGEGKKRKKFQFHSKKQKGGKCFFEVKTSNRDYSKNNDRNKYLIEHRSVILAASSEQEAVEWVEAINKARRNNRKGRIVLLGAGESGKTTCLQQLRISFMKECGLEETSKEEREAHFKKQIKRFTLCYMKMLCNFARDINFLPMDSGAKAHMNILMSSSPETCLEEQNVISKSLQNIWCLFAFVKHLTFLLLLFATGMERHDRALERPRFPIHLFQIERNQSTRLCRTVSRHFKF